MPKKKRFKGALKKLPTSKKAFIVLLFLTVVFTILYVYMGHKDHFYIQANINAFIQVIVITLAIFLVLSYFTIFKDNMWLCFLLSIFILTILLRGPFNFKKDYPYLIIAFIFLVGTALFSAYLFYTQFRKKTKKDRAYRYIHIILFILVIALPLLCGYLYYSVLSDIYRDIDFPSSIVVYLIAGSVLFVVNSILIYIIDRIKKIKKYLKAFFIAFIIIDVLIMGYITFWLTLLGSIGT